MLYKHLLLLTLLTVKFLVPTKTLCSKDSHETNHCRPGIPYKLIRITVRHNKCLLP